MKWPLVMSNCNRGMARGYLRKSLNARHSYPDRPIIVPLSAIDICNSIYKILFSEFVYMWPKFSSLLRPLHIGRKSKGASFRRKPFETLSTTGLQVELTPWIGTLRPVTSTYVAEVISCHERSPAVFSEWTFDIDIRQARAMKTPKLCSGRRSGSTDMQH